jgi:hypothetical protein
MPVFITQETITLTSNTLTGMTDFTGQCKYDSCTPPLPQFLMKPADQIIRLNTLKILALEISHPKAYSITTSYTISNAGEGIVTLRNNANLELMAKIPSQLGKHTLKITLTDYNLR